MQHENEKVCKSRQKNKELKILINVTTNQINERSMNFQKTK